VAWKPTLTAEFGLGAARTKSEPPFSGSGLGAGGGILVSGLSILTVAGPTDGCHSRGPGLGSSGSGMRPCLTPGNET
jgi:hypothetical protein